MRMWNVPTSFLCQKHLLGEHVETHMMIGSLRHGHSLQGYIDGGLINVHEIVSRHDTLAKELALRGMTHKSPLSYDKLYVAGSVNIERNIKELKHRCPDCKKRIENDG